jgi:hypothetical protein
MEKKNRFPGFVGPSYEARVGRFDCQKLINMYLEMDELGGGKNQEPAVMIGTPGLRKLINVGQGPIRGTYTASNQKVMYVVSGSQVFQISGNLSTPLAVQGELRTRSGAISIADNGKHVMIVDGKFGYTIEMGTLELKQITDPQFSPADVVSFQDGYFILNKKDTGYFFISDLYDITFPPLNEANKSGNSDVLISLVSNNRELYLFGKYTTEIWWNSGASASTPFTRQDGKFSQVGCIAPHSLVKLDNTLFWLGSNSNGGGIVYAMANEQPQRVSTHAIEYAIQRLPNLEKATAYAYQQEGHNFFVLNIPGHNTTWVFDATIGQWHERQSNIKGNTSRHLGETHCMFGNKHIIGCSKTNKLYEFDLDYFTDDGDPIVRTRQTPHAAQDLNRIFFHLLEVDLEVGMGLASENQDFADPKITLQISNDGGKTWGNEIYARVGRMGEYLTRARWSRLGSSRDRVFRVSISAPVRIAILGAMLDVETGDS